MKRKDINSGSRFFQKKQDLNQLTKIKSLDGHDDATKAAIVLQYLKEDTTGLTRTKRGQEILKKSLNDIKGTHWESVFYKKRDLTSYKSIEQKILKEFEWLGRTTKP